MTENQKSRLEVASVVSVVMILLLTLLHGCSLVQVLPCTDPTARALIDTLKKPGWSIDGDTFIRRDSVSVFINPDFAPSLGVKLATIDPDVTTYDGADPGEGDLSRACRMEAWHAARRYVLEPAAQRAKAQASARLSAALQGK